MRTAIDPVCVVFSSQHRVCLRQGEDGWPALDCGGRKGRVLETAARPRFSAPRSRCGEASGRAARLLVGSIEGPLPACDGRKGGSRILCVCGNDAYNAHDRQPWRLSACRELIRWPRIDSKRQRRRWSLLASRSLTQGRARDSPGAARAALYEHVRFATRPAVSCHGCHVGVQCRQPGPRLKSSISSILVVSLASNL